MRILRFMVNSSHSLAKYLKRINYLDPRGCMKGWRGVSLRSVSVVSRQILVRTKTYKLYTGLYTVNILRHFGVIFGT